MPTKPDESASEEVFQAISAEGAAEECGALRVKKMKSVMSRGMPARQFWSVIVYNLKTASFIPAASKRGIGSLDNAELKQNADSTTDIYFGPKPPTSLDSNWLPTGEDFF